VRLLKSFGVRTLYSADEVPAMYGLTRVEPLHEQWKVLAAPDKYNLILHPKSQGSGREWPLERYLELIRALDQNRFRIFISGTAAEKEALQPLLFAAAARVTDITGAMSLDQFISFIQHCDGLVASGTGPLHLAAALGRDAIGIFPPIRPVHPGRWRPLGPKAKVFVLPKSCDDCKGNPAGCTCMQGIEASKVAAYLERVSVFRGAALTSQ
jgi:heptosyltransferase III